MKYQKGIANLKQALKFLVWCRVIHWRYTKHPKWCWGNAGSIEHHTYCVKRYTEIINLLKKHCGGDPQNHEAKSRNATGLHVHAARHERRKTKSAETSSGMVTRKGIRTRPERGLKISIQRDARIKRCIGCGNGADFRYNPYSHYGYAIACNWAGCKKRTKWFHTEGDAINAWNMLNRKERK